MTCVTTGATASGPHSKRQKQLGVPGGSRASETPSTSRVICTKSSGPDCREKSASWRIRSGKPLRGPGRHILRHEILKRLPKTAPKLISSQLLASCCISSLESQRDRNALSSAPKQP